MTYPFFPYQLIHTYYFKNRLGHQGSGRLTTSAFVPSQEYHEPHVIYNETHGIFSNGVNYRPQLTCIYLFQIFSPHMRPKLIGPNLEESLFQTRERVEILAKWG